MTYNIPLKTKSQNFYYKDKSILYQYKLLCDKIDEDSVHQTHLVKGNETLNRYSNVRPYVYNAIKLKNKKYINASPINIINNNYFIATQGPISKTIEDFWTMIEENKSNVIVMLCRNIENGMEKCAEYWKANKLNNYLISVEKEEKMNGYILRKIKLFNKSLKKERIINQIHYISWPDHGIPKSEGNNVFDIFLEMIKRVDIFRDNKPIIIHCSAGVGRTGVFLNMYYLYNEIIQQIDNKEYEIKFNIFNLARKLKEMRILLVQTEIQYHFLYSFVKYLLDTFN